MIIYHNILDWNGLDLLCIVVVLSCILGICIYSEESTIHIGSKGGEIWMVEKINDASLQIMTGTDISGTDSTFQVTQAKVCFN